MSSAEHSTVDLLDPSSRPATDTRRSHGKGDPSSRAAAGAPAQPARRRRKGLLLALLVLAAALAGGGWWIFGRTEPPAVPYTVTVTRGTVQETVLASGTLEASSLVSVGARVSGTVNSVAVALGDAVTAGDTIATIDSLDQENAVKSAEASLANLNAQKASQEATLAQAQKAYDRASELSRQNLISETEMDSAEATLASAKAQLAALEAQIDQAEINVSTAKLNLSRTTITAPISGTVVAVLVQQGDTVSAQQSSPTIVKIANLDTMLIKAEISEADVTRVEAGQNVWFTILGDPETKVEATLRSVEPAPSSISDDSTSSSSSSSSTAVYYNGIFEVPNPDHRLRISMTAEVTIVLDEAKDALTVAVAALGPSLPDGKKMVEIYDGATGAITPQPVTVALDDGVTAAISDGLSEGQLVVTSGTSSGAAGAGNVTTTRSGTGLLGGARMGMGGGMGPPPG